MAPLIFSFTLSLVFTGIVLRYNHLHEHITADGFDGVQKFHSRPVPRVGGLSLVLCLIGSYGFLYFYNQQVCKFGLVLLVSAMPAFGLGFLEDITKQVGVRARLFATAASAACAGFLLDAWLPSLQIVGIDQLMSAFPVFAIFLTCFAVAGLANSFNIIDGYNGLAAMVGAIILSGIAYVAFHLGDNEIGVASLVMMGAVFGFLFFNYPLGLIFLGDGGAYLIGFWIAELSILLTVRHPEISKWFPLLLCFYPVFETLFTIYRRVLIHRTHPGMPDAAHLHQMIYKRAVRWAVGSNRSRDIVTRNFLTSPYLWAFTSATVLSAVLFWDNAWVLRGFSMFFLLIYVFFYWRLVNFKTPKWIIISKK